jgi:hypothetical protein
MLQYGQDSTEQIAGAASNIRAGINPPFSVGDFLLLYPQFGDNEGSPIIPEAVIQIYIDIAANSIQQGRYRSAWKMVTGLFVAHFCQLWLQTSSVPADGKEQIAAKGQVLGITTSESVDGVSYSVDSSAFMQDLDGFAAWKTTAYGLQLSTLAKLYGKGGMVIR